MPTGKVTAFVADRGFGFIAPDERGADVFVHVNNLVNADELQPGDRVQFEVVMDDRRGKPRADKVRVI
ncbi:CspA family cold shock protein [Nitrobacteraceae bacterium AZCC 2161]